MVEAERKQKRQIFISHAWEDKDIALGLEKELEFAGVDVWVDHSDIRGGDVFPERVSEAIESCDTLLLIWSQSADNSHWVKRTWATAINLGKTVIPCKIDRTKMPAILSSSAYVDFHDIDKGFAQLIKVLNIAPASQILESGKRNKFERFRVALKENIGKYLFTGTFISTIAIATLVFGLIIFLILEVLPRSTVIELDVFSRKVSFSLPPDVGGGEEVPLLYSGLWGRSVSVEKFQTIELNIDSVLMPMNIISLHNPLTITPNPFSGRVTFSSNATDISLQEMTCDSASKVSIQLDNENLYLEINESISAPRQTMSFGESVNISFQECNVKDGKNNDITLSFANPVTVRLHDLSKALNIEGTNGSLVTHIIEEETKGSIQFLLEQIVEELDFSEVMVRSFRATNQSTVDRISVKRNFPFDNVAFKSSGIGDLEVIAEPNGFLVYELSQEGDLLRVRAQGRLKSLRIGRGALMSEMVPGYLSLVAQYPAASTFITVLGWLITLIIPYLFMHRP